MGKNTEAQVKATCTRTQDRWVAQWGVKCRACEDRGHGFGHGTHAPTPQTPALNSQLKATPVLFTAYWRCDRDCFDVHKVFWPPHEGTHWLQLHPLLYHIFNYSSSWVCNLRTDCLCFLSYHNSGCNKLLFYHRNIFPKIHSFYSNFWYLDHH